ncbi:cold-shock protein [Enterobacter sp. Bisph1]|uniref:cold shock small protein YmcF n=1 Tax=Enterobacter sp. Bisph1 TaxID=1274399 RepID=UPI0009078FB9|nr:cold-shock protein [Enterobacter sp. Bisph1]
MITNIHFRCPCCHGSQYRVSSFDVTEKNPVGAKCIFCKTPMMTFDTIAAYAQQSQAPMEFRK